MERFDNFGIISVMSHKMYLEPFLELPNVLMLANSISH